MRQKLPQRPIGLRSTEEGCQKLRHPQRRAPRPPKPGSDRRLFLPRWRIFEIPWSRNKRRRRNCPAGRDGCRRSRRVPDWAAFGANNATLPPRGIPKPGWNLPFAGSAGPRGCPCPRRCRPEASWRSCPRHQTCGPTCGKKPPRRTGERPLYCLLRLWQKEIRWKPLAREEKTAVDFAPAALRSPTDRPLLSSAG